MNEQNYIRIAFEDMENKKGEILHIVLPCQPFVVGQGSFVKLSYVQRIHQYVDFRISVVKG